MMFNIQLSPEAIQVAWNAMMERPAKEVLTTLLTFRAQIEAQEARENSNMVAAQKAAFAAEFEAKARSAEAAKVAESKPADAPAATPLPTIPKEPGDAG